MDRTPDCGSGNPGSIPGEGTRLFATIGSMKRYILLLVAAVALAGGGFYIGRMMAGGQALTRQSASQEVLDAKFRFALLDFWQVRDAYADPVHPSQYYYVSTDGSGGNVWMYDMDKDPSDHEHGDFNIPAGNTNLLNIPLEQYKELRSVGITDNKFVFFETYNDSSPGPCSTDWLRDNLQYIDLGNPRPTAKPFSISSAMKAAKEQEEQVCEKNL